MSKQLLAIAEAVACEKAMPVQAVIRAMETALAAAVRRREGTPFANIEVRIDEQGQMQVLRHMAVVERVEEPQCEMEAVSPRKPGDVFTMVLEPLELTRQAAQTVKQVIIQTLRQEAREQQADAWKPRVGEIIYGAVRRVDRQGGAWVEMGDGTEAFLPASQRIPGEIIKPGSRVRALLADADASTRGCPLVLSRKSPDFVQALMRTEIPEIGEGLIRIVGVARDAGRRSKVAIAPMPGFQGDPIGACIGIRGARIQAACNDLNGERIDIILFDEEPSQFVLNALVPAEVSRLVVDEDKREVLAAVDARRLAMAIGKGGQNVRLASQLTGWEIQVMDPETLDAKLQAEQDAQRQVLMKELGTDAELADVLIECGITSPSDLVEGDTEAFLVSEGFDAELIGELVERAREVQLDEALRVAGEEAALDAFPGVTLDASLAQRLRAAGVDGSEELAELAADELVERLGDFDGTEAGHLIMQAREYCWFRHAA